MKIRVRTCLILSGDQLYRMDYQKLIEDASQEQRGGDDSPSCRCAKIKRRSSVCCVPTTAGRVTSFVEKPQNRRQARTGAQ